MNFWQKLDKPFFCLAPMDDVTDVVFREIVAQTSRPDVFFTEFTNVEGLNSPGRKKLLPRLKFTENQRPIIAQIWGKDPKNFFKVAGDLKKMGFDGIDINMGCPVKNVVQNGTCSALIKNPKLAGEIIEATIKGGKGLPVSVKTRLGYSDYQTEEWIGFLLTLPLSAITIHGRTVKQMSKVPANWEEIGKAVELRDRVQGTGYKGQRTLIVGNGDVRDRRHGEELAKRYGVDGIMIGRGIFEDPYCFSKNHQPLTMNHRLELLLKHAKLFDETFGKTKPFKIMRKFAKAYIKDFSGAADLRAQLMETNSLLELEKTIKEYYNRSNAGTNV